MLHRCRIYTRMLPLSVGQKVKMQAIVLHLVKCHSCCKTAAVTENVRFQLLRNFLKSTAGLFCVRVFNIRVVWSLSADFMLWNTTTTCSYVIHCLFRSSVTPTLRPCGQDQTAVIMLIWAVSHQEKREGERERERISLISVCVCVWLYVQ